MKEEDAILMDRFRATRRIFWTVIENLDEELFQARDRLITAISEVARLVNEDPEASKRMLEIIEEALERVDTVRKTLEGA